MKVGIACESSSFLLKEAVKKHIAGLGYEVVVNMPKLKILTK